MSLALTIAQNKEIVLAYKDITTDDQWFVYGDTALARIDQASVGDLTRHTFYLVVYVKRKWGSATFDIPFITNTSGFLRSS
jgi:hypothetical protein